MVSYEALMWTKQLSAEVGNFFVIAVGNFMVDENIWDKDVRRRTKSEYTAVVKRGTQKLEVLWRVTSNPEYGYPGPFDREVHRAIEQIMSEYPLPIQNPISIGSLYGLCKRMGINSFGGSQYRKIKEALERLTTTSIKSEGSFYNKEQKEWIEEIFHLYERVIFKGRTLPNGEIADTNYLYLNSWYLDNINANYVKPMDWEYCRLLENPISQRLYELLSVKFYGLLSRGGRVLSYKYSTLCSLLPIVQQKYLSLAKKILEPSHEKLNETNFLADWHWEETTRGAENDWLIKYYPGKRIKDEIKRFSLGEQLKFELPSPKAEQEPIDESELSTEESKIVAELVQRVITKTTARKLVKDYPIEKIQKQIEVFDWLKETESQRIGTNAPGFLRKSIEENYQPPDEYITHLDRQTRRQEVKDRKERWLRNREKLIQQDISKWDTITPKERVQAMLDAWIFIQSRPNQNEIDSMQQKLIDNLPKTDEEKRKYIARNHPEDPSPDFE